MNFALGGVLLPDGDHAKQSLKVQHTRDGVDVLDPHYANGAGVKLDWWNDRLQILVYDGITDEPVLTVCLNKDGTVAHDQDAWRKERDDPNHE